MRFVAIVLFFFVQSAVASAETYDIDLTDLMTTSGIVGPCYCTTTLSVSPVISVQPGDVVNFGTLEIFSFQSAATPDAGPNQPAFFLQGSPAADFFGEHLPGGFLPTVYGINSPPAPTIYDLTYTVPIDSDSIQIYWEGPYSYAPYIAAVPEPSTWAMLLIGFAGIGFAGYRRSKPTGQPPDTPILTTV